MRYSSILTAGAAIGIVGMLVGCTKPDLRIVEASARATAPDAADFAFTVENRDYAGNIFIRPGKVSGPVDVHAWSSTDGVTKHRPVSWYFIFLFDGQQLNPGQTKSGTGRTTVDGGIDLTAEPYLILVVDERDEKDEFKENNNSFAVEITVP